MVPPALPGGTITWRPFHLVRRPGIDSPTPVLLRVDAIAPVPWRNGGGQTRELLAWPEPSDWIVRISVAEILASGPFSDFPGVDRWFAVLRGGTVRLETRGAAAHELGAGQRELHPFPGDAPTHCSALGAATCDFNVMLRRARGCLQQRALDGNPALRTSASLVVLFAVEAVDVTTGSTTPLALPGMALAWWNNARHAPLALEAHAAEPVRGWWLEADAAL